MSMKKLLFILVILLTVLANGQAQDKLKIGEVRDGKLVVTNLTGLKAFFMNDLEKSGTLANEYQVSASPEGDRFLVWFPVSGNKNNIRSIGVMLVKIKGDVFIISNPPGTPINSAGGEASLEITCTGVDCNDCVPNVRWGSNWIPEVYCECRSGGGGKCNMTTKLVIKVNAGT
jgi:hypothetical protein